MKEGNNYLLLPPPASAANPAPELASGKRDYSHNFPHTKKKKTLGKGRKEKQGVIHSAAGRGGGGKETDTHNRFPGGVSYYCSSCRNCAGIALHIVIYASALHIRERTCCSVVCPQFSNAEDLRAKVRFPNLGTDTTPKGTTLRTVFHLWNSCHAWIFLSVRWGKVTSTAGDGICRGGKDRG